MKKMVFSEANSVEAILNILLEFDECFIPSISSRIGSLSNYAQKLYTYGKVFFLANEKETIGFVAYYSNDKINKIVYLTQIGIKKEYSGLGVGTKLLNYVINDAEKNRMKSIKLEVFQGNFSAIKLYEKFSFNLFENKGEYYILEKILN